MRAGTMGVVLSCVDQLCGEGDKTVPQVSVVIPTKGRPVLVRRAVDSVLNQTLRDIELIVIVDGPDPETEATLAEIGDTRVKIIVNPQSSGASLARNIGADAAQAKWLAFLDDDDEWLPEKLEKQLSFAEAQHASGKNRFILTCLSLVITPYGEGIRPREIYDPREPIDQWLFDRRSLLGGQSFFQTSSVFVETALFQKIRFQSPRQHDDWDMLLRAQRDWATTLLTVPEVLVRHYMDQKWVSLTNNHRVRESVNWLETTRGLVTPRGYSGFCLTVIGQHAARLRDWAMFWFLLHRAFTKGSPTALQLAVYFSVWLFPRGLRRRLSFSLGKGHSRVPGVKTQ